MRNIFYRFSAVFLSVAIVAAAGFYFNVPRAYASTGTITWVYTSSGTWTAPAGVTSVTASAWGGGGGGSNASAGGAGGAGGGGGGFAQSTITVVPATGYTVTIGAGGAGGIIFGAAATNGATTTFDTAAILLAKPGLAGVIGTGGIGGTSGGGAIGTTTFAGGTGGVDGSVDGAGGGGGGAGGTTAAGGTGGNSSGTFVGGAGGTGGVYGGGLGANGGGSIDPVAPADWGGGGGGGTAGASSNGGIGASGAVTISYPNTTPNNVVIFVSGAGAGVEPYVTPTDWNSSNNQVACIGSGGNGGTGASAAGAGGGGSGAYASTTNLTISGVVKFSVGASATTTQSSSTPAAAVETFFNGTASSTSSVTCDWGKLPLTTTGGVAGATANSIGTTKFAGAAGGGSGASQTGGGGAGSAGEFGAGFAGGAGSASGGGGGGGGSNGRSGSIGSGGAASGGTGGNGTTGTGGGATHGGNATAGTGAGGGGGDATTGAGGIGAIDSSFITGAGAGGGGGGGRISANNGGAGGTYGSGGGGGGSTTRPGGAGGQGEIVITYTPSPQLMQILTDTFPGVALDSTKWTNSIGAVSVSGNIVSLNTPLNSTQYSDFDSGSGGVQQFYNLTSSYSEVQVVSAGNQALASWEVFPIQLFKDSSNLVRWYITGGNISALKTVGGSGSTVATASYVAATYKYLRIRESGGTIFWDYSADGITWSNFTSLANPFAVTALYVELSAGSFSGEASSTASFMNYNILPTVSPSGPAVFFIKGGSLKIKGGLVIR